MLKAAIMTHLFIYLFIFPFVSHLKAVIIQWVTLGIPLQSVLATPYYNPSLSLTAHGQKTQTTTPIRREMPWTRKVVSVGLSFPKTHVDLPNSSLHTDVALEFFLLLNVRYTHAHI